MKFNSVFAIIAGALVLSVAGCKSGGDEGTAAEPTGGAAATSDSGQPVASGTPGPAPVINSPSEAAGMANRSFRIKPANPNDPKYKADPRLAGGG